MRIRMAIPQEESVYLKTQLDHSWAYIQSALTPSTEIENILDTHQLMNQ